MSSVCLNSTTWFPNWGTGTSRICTYGKISTMCNAVCRWTRGPVAPAAPTASWAAPRRAPRRGQRAPAREELSSGTRPCSAPHVPAPWPWLFSGPVGRYGASLLPGPSRRSSVHTSSKHGGVVLRRLAAPVACAARSTAHMKLHKRSHNKKRVTLERKLVLLLCVVCCCC